jgi:hypothetical protein
MSEERKRTSRARSTSSNSTTRRSSAAKQSAQRAKRTTNSSAADHDTLKSELPTTDTAPDTTLGEETWRPEMTDADAFTADDAPLADVLPPPVAEFDGAATDDTTPEQTFIPIDILTREDDDLTAGLDNIALPMTTGESAFNQDDTSVAAQQMPQPAPMPRAAGKATAPMPLTTGKATAPMPMQQRAAETSPVVPTKLKMPGGLPFDERWLTLIGGGALTVAGVLRRGWPGALMGIAGASLLARGIIQTVRGRTQPAANATQRGSGAKAAPEALTHSGKRH